MTASRSFTLAAKAEVEESEHQPISYELIDPDTDEVRTVTAHYPGDGRLTLLLATAGASETSTNSEMAVAGEMFDVLQHAFDAADYRYIRQMVAAEKFPLDLLAEMMRDMMERWTAFPTKPSSGSTPSPRGTGTRSTGRSPSKGSIQQRSLPVDS